VVAPRGPRPRLALDRRLLTALGILLLVGLCAGAIYAGRNLISSAFAALSGRPPAARETPVSLDNPGGELAVVVRQDGVDRVVLMNPATGHSTRLPAPDGTEGSWSPQWSPDGQRLAWLNQVDGRGSIYLYNLQSQDGLVARASEGYNQVTAPAWLPGGERVAFYAYGEGASWLVIANQDGERENAIRLPEYRNLFVWNWKEDLLAFAHRSGVRFDVSVASDPAGSGVTLETAGEEYAPAWSNDGRWLAFQSDAGRSPGMNEIWIARADGSQLRQVTTTPQGFWSRGPSWSPDGRYIAYVSSQNGSQGFDYGELFIVEVETGRSRQVTDTGGWVYDWRVAWRPR
jgi:Tol biopolymer transport system component